MKYLLMVVWLLISISVQSQTKTIVGDTTYWHKHVNPILRDIEARDFVKSDNDFNFRLQYYGQVIDIWKSNDKVGGSLTNYIFKSGIKRESKKETVYQKNILPDSIVYKVLHIINTTDILNLGSEEEIEGWRQGFDGITYTIEHSDENNYWHKTYWAPYLQDSLKESLVVIDFVNSISDLVKTKESYNQFETDLPHNGCYTQASTHIMCYSPSSLSVGYIGTHKLPLGYTAFYSSSYIGNLRTGFGLSVSHQFDTHGDYDFSTSASKWDLLSNSKKGNGDFLQYTYRLRKDQHIKDGTIYRNHQILYGLRLKSTNVSLGVDFLNGEKNKTGGIIAIKQNILKSQFSLDGKSSIFKDQFDYTIGISKYIPVYTKLFSGAFVDLYYENFAGHGNIGWGLSFLL